MSKKSLLKKWQPLVESEGMPAIASMQRKDIVARIFENQDEDIAHNEGGVYTDQVVVNSMVDVKGRLEEAKALQEANIGGDHGYDATKIASGEMSGSITNVGPAVMGLVRRAIPQLIAFDICGVQPMTSSTGQVFTLRAIYGGDSQDSNAREAFHPAFSPDADFSGRGAQVKIAEFARGTAFANGAFAHLFIEAATGVQAGTKTVQFIKDYAIDALPAEQVEAGLAYKWLLAQGYAVETSSAMATAFAELQQGFNGSTGNEWNEMSFRIDKQVVEAKSRQLKAQYSIEMAQDLRAVHGLDADSELSSILANEIMHEINREMVLWINATAKVGKTGWTNMHGGKSGVFDFQDTKDIRGARWAGESYKALVVQIDKEANEIARQTGRGQGNFIICSRNVAAALGHTDMMVTPAAQGANTTMNTDTTSSLFAGVLAGKYRVYIDQYAVEDYFTVGYKGSSEMDAGLFYCPYVALTPLRGTDPKNFQPVLGFKTRYGVKLHPMADSMQNKGFAKITNGMPQHTNMFGKNAFFRRVLVAGV